MAYTQPPTRASSDPVVNTDWNTYVRDNFIELEARKETDNNEGTADVTVSATSAATATTIITADPFTPNGTDQYRITFQCFVEVAANAGGNQCIFHLYDGATNLGRIAWAGTSANAIAYHSIFAERTLTPTNASHTYSVRAHRTNANCTVQAGNGTADVEFPIVIRVTRLP